MVSTSKIEEIEILRAVAVLFVIWQHLAWLTGRPDWVIPGFSYWFGVDLFFAISGFVITRSLLREPLTIRSTLQFWKRRALRLLPAAWFWIVASLIVAAVFVPSQFQATVTDAATAFFQVANINLHLCGEVGTHACGIAPQYWSLSLEEQFYALLPVFFLLFGVRSWPVLVVLAAVQFFIPRAGGFGLFGMIKFDALIWGSLIALASGHVLYTRIVGFIPPIVRLGLTVALLFLMARLASGNTGFPLYMGLIGVCGAAIVFLASGWAELIPVRRTFVVLGSRSYGIYLAHIPCFVAVHAIMGDAAFLPLHLLVGLGAIAISSELVFRYIERPWRLPARSAVAADHSSA